MGNIVSQEVFEYLLDHLLDIHNRKLGIVSAYTIDYDSYMEKLNFLNLYIRGIESFLETTLTDKNKMTLPIVVLGSTVCIRCIDTDECIFMKVVLPDNQACPCEKDIDIHTCFSDCGRALLLKRVGDRIRLGHTPHEHVIERIAFDIIKAPLDVCMDNLP